MSNRNWIVGKTYLTVIGSSRKLVYIGENELVFSNGCGTLFLYNISGHLIQDDLTSKARADMVIAPDTVTVYAVVGQHGVTNCFAREESARLYCGPNSIIVPCKGEVK